MDVLTRLRPAGGERGRWIDGRVYDPASGSTYLCTLEVDADRIELRGYVGPPIIGRTSTWYRFGGQAQVCGR